MFKRLRWLTIGAIAGASGSVWFQRRVRERLDRLQPEHVARRAVGSAQSYSRELRAAVTEGRQTMRAREAELRQASRR